MKYAVDKIENNIAVLENIISGEIVNEDLKNLPKDLKEKDILIYKDGTYVLNNKEKLNRILMLKEKMARLKK